MAIEQSMDWFTGKFTGNHRCSHIYIGLIPVSIFPSTNPLIKISGVYIYSHTIFIVDIYSRSIVTWTYKSTQFNLYIKFPLNPIKSP